MTYSGIVEDYWAHAHANDPKLREMAVDEDYAAALAELGLDASDLEDAPAGDSDGIVDDVTYEDPAAQ